MSTALEARRVQREVEREQRSAIDRRETELRAMELDMRASGVGRGATDLSADEYAALVTATKEAEFRSYLLTGQTPMGLQPIRSLDYAEQRDQGIGAGAAGGFLVPARMADKLVAAERAFGSMLRVVNVIETPDGRPLSRPGIDDSGASSSIVTENTVLGAGVDWTVANNTALVAYQYATTPLKVSVQLDTDVAPGANGGFSLEDAIAEQLGRRLGRKLNLDLTLGTGASQPLGAFTAGAMTVGVTLATGNAAGFASTAIALAALRALRDSVDEAYWDDACWVMNVATHTALGALVDTQGHPIFNDETPLTPLGFPVVVNKDAPAWGANIPIIGFGSWKRGFTVRTTPQAIHRLGERFADNLQVGFFASIRADGRPSGDAGAIKMMLASAT